MYTSISSRLKAYNFACHPRVNKIFKVHKRNRNSLEEYSSEEWARKPKRHCGYLESKSTTFSLVCKKLVGENKNINDEII